MPKYKVYVTGTIDDDFEIEAANAGVAFKLAEVEFKNKHRFRAGAWTNVTAGSFELADGEDEQGLDDGF